MKPMPLLIVAIIALIAGILSLRWLAKSREDTTWADAPRPGKVVTLDGVSLHYVEAGNRNNPAIVMIHGFGGHTFSYRYQLKDLSRDFYAVAIDLKGFGWTGRPPGDYSPAAQARLVWRVLDARKVGDDAVVGHSWGASVALAMAPFCVAISHSCSSLK